MTAEFSAALCIEHSSGQHPAGGTLIKCDCLFQLLFDGIRDAESTHLFHGVELTQEADIGLHTAIGSLPSRFQTAIPANGLIRRLRQAFHGPITDDLHLFREASQSIGIIAQGLIHIGIAAIERQQGILLLSIVLLLLLHDLDCGGVDELSVGHPRQCIIGCSLG